MKYLERPDSEMTRFPIQPGPAESLMALTKRVSFLPWLATFIVALALLPAWAQSPADASASALRPVGTVKSVEGNTVTLTTDAGQEVRILVKETTRMMQAAPGLSPQELKNAPVLKLSDLQPGDRMTVRGTAAPDGQIAASTVLVMKKADVIARQERERQDWQQRGVGGLVASVDAAARTVTISVVSIAG